ncbi:MAG: acyltransferase [Oscillospiraceae bacterium]|jgi:surface polysaccharide O-acyltransferase-like enzyme|nr:acyltransferase [Oscillospiraceae bacterium]
MKNEQNNENRLPKRKPVRNANIELLRILSIFLIVIHHYSIYSGWTFKPGYSTPELTVFFLSMFGKVGVCLFVYITGYFMVQSTTKWQAIANLAIKTSLVLLLIYMVQIIFQLGDPVVNFPTILHRALPAIFGQYWFVTAYILMYLALPILNPFLQGLTRKQYGRALLIAFLVLSVWPMIYRRDGMTFSFPVYLLFLYAVGGYIRRFGDTLRNIKRWKLVAIFSLLVLIAIGIHLFLRSLDPDGYLYQALIKEHGWNENTLVRTDPSPLVFFISLPIFLFFVHWDLKIRERTSRVIAKIAAGTFTVYLLQSAPSFHMYIWKELLNGARFSRSIYIAGWGILCTVGIFISGIALSFVTDPITALLMRLLEKLIERIKSGTARQRNASS